MPDETIQPAIAHPGPLPGLPKAGLQAFAPASIAEFDAAAPGLAAARSLVEEAYAMGALLSIEQLLLGAPCPIRSIHFRTDLGRTVRTAVLLPTSDGGEAQLEEAVLALMDDGAGERGRLLKKDFESVGCRALSDFNERAERAGSQLDRALPDFFARRIGVALGPSADLPSISSQLGLGHLGARVEAARIAAGAGPGREAPKAPRAL